MSLITDLDHLPSLQKPCGLTIGFFDGVHLGHQALLHHLRQQVPKPAKLVVFTFSNHPSHLFNPKHPTPLIVPTEQKIELLFSHGADVVICIPFTEEFARIPFDTFLKTLKEKLRFTHLVLGEGASFGKNREGDQAHVKALASELGFTALYLPKAKEEQKPISSARIRSLISQGDLNQVSSYLGRPYSLKGSPEKENNHLVCRFPLLSLPPSGIYPAQVCQKSCQQMQVEVSQEQKKIFLLDPSLESIEEQSNLLIFF